MTPPEVDMRSVKRVLIIKLSALGDVIHALPVSAALRSSFPDIELTWAIEEGFSPLVAGNPCLNNILMLPKVKGRHLRSPSFHRDYFRRLRDVRMRRFDLTLDLQGLTKSAVVAAASGAPLRIGYHWLREAASFFERPVPRRPDSVHIVDQYLDVARFLGATVEQPVFPFHIPEADADAVTAMLEENGIKPGDPFVSINPASALAIKQWSAENFAALIDIIARRLSLPCVLVTADMAVASCVEAAARRPFINLAGHTNLKQLASVLDRSAVHVCGDTGSGHLAAALGARVVALVGPTDAERICPYGQRRFVLRHSDCCHRTCKPHHCHYTYPRCLAAIQVNEVAACVEGAFREVS